MPWKETCVTDERLHFVAACHEGDESMTELCLRFGISRKTGYKWLERYTMQQLDGLRNRSHAARVHPNATPQDVERALIEFRQVHPLWGPKKLIARLRVLQPGIPWPAASTAGELLKRQGLVSPRRKRRRTPPYTQPFVSCLSPNVVWCGDLKGWFYTGDGQRCDTFTLSEAYSRFLLRCQVVPRPNRHWIQAICDAAFREYGLPDAIRTDNGPPFATPSLGGLSRLAIHWIKLGILPERIAPGRPDQNGRHERMHRTLKAHTATPPRANRHRQQVAYDCFRQEYNHERPHESLEQHTPASVFTPSPRPFPRRIPDVTYPDGYQVRRVRINGQIKWHGHEMYLSERLTGEPVGLRQQDDDLWLLYFGPIYLATWDQRHQKLVRPRRRNGQLHEAKY